MKTGEQLGSVGKQLASGRQNPGAGSGNLRGEHTRRIRDVRRWGICSLRIAVKCGQRPRRFKITVDTVTVPSLRRSLHWPPPRLPGMGGVEPGSKSGPPPSFPNDPIGNPGALGLGSINSVIAIIQRHWIPDWIIRGRRYKKDFHSPPSGSSGKFPAMRSGQIPQRPKDVNSPRVYSSQIPRPYPCPLRQLHYCFTRHVWSQFHNCFTQDEAEPWLLLHLRLNSKQMHVSCEFS